MADVKALYPLFVVQFRGPRSSGYVVLRAKDEKQAEELSRAREVVMPPTAKIVSVTELIDPGGPGPIYSCFVVDAKPTCQERDGRSTGRDQTGPRTRA